MHQLTFRIERCHALGAKAFPANLDTGASVSVFQRNHAGDLGIQDQQLVAEFELIEIR